MKKLWGILKPLIRNKFFITVLIFMVWILFFDQNNLLERRKAMKKLYEMEEKKQYYIERIENDTRRLNELRTNDKNLEKFAREEYLMKKENEDIFLIVEE